MPAPTATPTTSWWYGKGRAVDVVRRLETLQAITPPPGPVGAVTARHDEITAAFVEPLKTPLPPPWQPAGAEACIAWSAISPGSEPDPGRPVNLVVFGVTGKGELLGLNLAAFSRIRITGDRDVACAMVNRWILELVCTHPAATVGVTADVWPGPYTTRVRPAAAGKPTEANVLILGGELTYAERAQIAAAATSPILIDLGADAAAATKWTITCGADHAGQITNGRHTMDATLIIPTPAVIDQCRELLTTPHPAATPPPGPVPADPTTTHGDTAPPPPAEPSVDFFAADPTTTPNPDEPAEDPWLTAGPQAPPATEAQALPTPEPPPPPPVETQPIPTPPAPSPSPALTATAAAASDPPPVAPIWNRILGPVQLCPPQGGPPGAREKRLNELTVFLQRHSWVTPAEIIEHILGGAASEKTVTQQISLLRSRLGEVSPGVPALPTMHDGQYHFDKHVRSDWMEFDDLVAILVEHTPTAHLVVAMDLITGPPLGGIGTGEWKFADDLRDEIRSRAADTAHVLARRHTAAANHTEALTIARKGLWYDSARQDLWRLALAAAADARDSTAFRDLRSQYLAEIPGPQRDPTVLDLTERSG